MSICGIQKGNDLLFDVEVSDESGPIDISTGTGFTVQFMMKTDIALPDNNGLPQVLGPVIGVPSSTYVGIATISIDSSDTEQLEAVKYYYEVRLYDARLVPAGVYTLEMGTVFVKPAVFQTSQTVFIP